MDTVEQAAENLRNEPYHLFTNDCISKSIRLKRMFPDKHILVCINLGHWHWFPTIHAWAVWEGKRLETSRPIGEAGFMGIIPSEIVPIVGFWIGKI